MPISPTSAGLRSPYWLLALGVLAASTGSIFARLAEAPALALAFWRCAIAAAVLLPLSRRTLAAELPRLAPGVRWLAPAAGAFLALHFATWIASLEHTTVASSVVLVSTAPVWVALLSAPLAGERPAPRSLVGIALCLGGALAIAAGDFRAGGEALLGDGLALCGALSAALYFLIGRRLRAACSLPTYLVLCYGTAALVLAPAALAAGTPLTGFSSATWGWILALALVPQLIGHSLCNWALRRASATLVSVSLLGEPILAPLLAWWIFAERPGATLVLGGALVLGGIALVAGAEGRAPRPGRGLRAS